MNQDEFDRLYPEYENNFLESFSEEQEELEEITDLDEDDTKTSETNK